MLHQVEAVVHLKAHAVEPPQHRHGPLQICVAVGIAAADVFQEPGHLQAVFRVEIGRIVAEPQAGDGLIALRLQRPVDQISRALAGDPENVAPVLAGKQIRPVGHALGKRPDVCDVAHLGSQGFGDHGELLGVDGGGDLLLDPEQGPVGLSALQQPFHRLSALRGAHIHQHVSGLELHIGPRRDPDVLPPADGHDGGAGALPEPQFPDAHAQLIGILRHPDLVVREALLRGQRHGTGGHQIRDDLRHLLADGAVLLEQELKPLPHVDLILPDLNRFQIGLRLFRGEHHGAAALPDGDDPHIRQNPQRLPYRLRRHAVFRRQHRAAGDLLALPELSHRDPGCYAGGDPHIMGKGFIIHGRNSLLKEYPHYITAIFNCQVWLALYCSRVFFLFRRKRTFSIARPHFLL